MKMPVIFVGHGSPMNAIEQNRYTDAWRELGARIKPKAILMVSAHWFTRGTYTQSELEPPVINDMYGFPKPLYEVNYKVKGDAELTAYVQKALGSSVGINNEWGIDHGTWSVLVHMYPNRDIPVVQLSVDALKGPDAHFELGTKLSALRNEGILVMGSGNIVHNLRRVDFQNEGGADWADQFDRDIKEAILAKDFKRCIDYKQFGEAASLAVPTTDHYDPLLYCLGASDASDQIKVFNDERTLNALSMTGYVFE